MRKFVAAFVVAALMVALLVLAGGAGAAGANPRCKGHSYQGACHNND